MPQLDFSTFAAQIFWLFVSFIFLYFVLSRFAIPKISAVKSKRDDLRESDLASAAKAEREAASLETQWKVAMAQSRARAANVVQDAENRVRTSELAHLAKAKQTIETMEKAANQNLAQTIEQVEAELPSHVVELASKLVARVSGQSVAPSDIKTGASKK